MYTQCNIYVLIYAFVLQALLQVAKNLFTHLGKCLLDSISTSSLCTSDYNNCVQNQSQQESEDKKAIAKAPVFVTSLSDLNTLPHDRDSRQGASSGSSVYFSIASGTDSKMEVTPSCSYVDDDDNNYINKEVGIVKSLPAVYKEGKERPTCSTAAKTSSNTNIIVRDYLRSSSSLGSDVIDDNPHLSQLNGSFTVEIISDLNITHKLMFSMLDRPDKSDKIKEAGLSGLRMLGYVEPFPCAGANCKRLGITCSEEFRSIWLSLVCIVILV